MRSALQQSSRIPDPGQIVRVRQRHWLVEAIDPPTVPTQGHIVSLVCIEDDAQGEALQCLWELELFPSIVDEEAWKTLGARGFDAPRHFSAYLHALRWNCVTATDPTLFQAPFRAGIRIDAYQLEPLRKALRLPRVNLFIADDVGLGKTIEAGLVASELLLRRRIREIVVACPPSMLEQWKEELEQRFGLIFEILDRAFIERIRQERGYSVNPWTTFPRFLISHKLLIDETYAAPLRDWLQNLRPGTLLILDEAHHAAPASGSRYAIDSKITRAIRDLAPRFEHRLFLSATPHNGHSNSFSALLELLDPQRFTRGVPVLKNHLNDIMVRRLKEDIRTLAGGFPERRIVQIDISNLPDSAPELALSRLLDSYRDVRQRRLATATKRQQAEALLLVSGLQQRLLSSIDAFAHTLAVHRRTMERLWLKQSSPPASPAPSSVSTLQLFTDSPDPDSDRAALSDDEIRAQEDSGITAATLATSGDLAAADISSERRLLDEMASISGLARATPDARICWLVDWIRQHMCSGAAIPGSARPQAGASWSDRRIIIFTEYGDTRRYLQQMLQTAIVGTDRASQRIAIFHGPTPPHERASIKRAFNLPPAEHPVRILIATDAAREGLNFQSHCCHLFHFDVPWNPSRLEQRNGRIDRKLQPSPEVFCHYFVYHQRVEDRVLKALVRKTETIRAQLGSLSQVLESRLASAIRNGIRHSDAAALEQQISATDLDPDKRSTAEDELESSRDRRESLARQIDSLRNRINDARSWIGLSNDHFRDALSCALELSGAEPLQQTPSPPGLPARFDFPNLALRRGGESSWAATLDSLRKPPEDGPRDFTWRRDAPIRPVTFDAPDTVDDDSVQLHLEHRVVRRLLSRFTSQGFVHHDLSRACLAHSQDAIPRIVLLGRLSVYGHAAVRLHEEIITVTARWTDPASRKDPLSPYARDAESRTLQLLENGLAPGTRHSIPAASRERLAASMAQDIAELLPHLESRGLASKSDAEHRLTERGRIEADGMRKILEDQKKRVLAEAGNSSASPLLPGFDDSERRQLESNRRYWQRWLENVDRDLSIEPARILKFYQPQSHRIEPVGLAYLWPVTG
jgi:superfamily II DNA or RNA helicase